MKKIFLTLVAVLCSAWAGAEGVRVASLFGDGMVVQRGQTIPVWGWGPTGERVTVTLNGRTRTTTVGSDGCWRVELPSMKAGGPYTLTAGGREVRDVMVGDVYLFSGQSNMELPVSRCMERVGDAVRGYSNANVRYVKLPPQYNYLRPEADCQTLGWQAVTPETAPAMSAVSYFAARYLQEAHGVAVGIINSSVGGTGVEAWMSRDTLLRHTEWTQELAGDKYRRANWVDSTRRAETARAAEWGRRAAASDPLSIHTLSRGDWHDVDLFSRWSTGYGTYWFRRTVVLTRGETGATVLHLGAMKDADSAFVNGHFVGTTPYEYPPRHYAVPAGVLHEGENEIVVRLTAEGGVPNFTRGKEYALAGHSLEDGWQMARGAVMEARPGQTYFVNTPTALYNAMIAPLGDVRLSGMVWYQGENNTGMKRGEYLSLFSSLVRCWRAQLGQDVPMVCVQLAGYMGQHEQPVAQSGWCEVRLAELAATERLPRVALATAVDLGESNDIHPQRKDELGRRVALQFGRMVYGSREVAEGPRMVKAERRGDKIVVTYSRETGALRRDFVAVRYAALTSGGYTWAEGRVVGPYTVEVSAPAGATQLRYAYDDFPRLTLYNVYGLPAPTQEVSVR